MNQEPFKLGRRQFVRQAAIGGAFLMATESLAAETERRSRFPGRGTHERLALKYLIVRAGAARPFSVLHLSDTHLTAAYADEQVAIDGIADYRTQLFGGLQEEALTDSIDWARKHVDLVLHTGDLIDWKTKANLELVRKHFGPQMLGCLGNHEFCSGRTDDPCTECEAYKERSWKVLGESYPGDVRFQSKVVNGVNFVLMDDAFGTVQADQVKRFSAEARKGLPIVLCVHVPFFTPDLWLAYDRFWAQNGQRFTAQTPPAAREDYLRQQRDPVTRNFIASLKTEKRLCAILAGHLHFSFQERFSSTAVQSVVGANFLFQGEEVLFV